MTEASSSTTVILHGAWPFADPFNSNVNSNSRTIIPIGTASDGNDVSGRYTGRQVQRVLVVALVQRKLLSPPPPVLHSWFWLQCKLVRLRGDGLFMLVRVSTWQATLIKGALGYYAVQLFANSNGAGGGATMFSCDLDPPNFNSNSDPDLDLQVQCVHWVISSIPTMTTLTSFSMQTISGSNADFATNAALTTWSFILHRFSVLPVTALSSKFSFPTSNSKPGNHDTTTGMTTSPLTNGKVDESSKMHSQAPSRYSIVPTTWGLMGNGFAVCGQLITTNVKNFHRFPTGILGPELMDKFRKQSLRFGTRIITETISKIVLSHRPFRYWREGQGDEEPETADMVVVATGASEKEVGIERFRFSDVTLLWDTQEQTPLTVIGGDDSATKEATFTSCF
ncbi:hypothetical protein K435DRAFT_802696 [Dendrothele bispora CBS 962.96]|uniref:FAD/NAD(P)-binding domain-containing protein n=1 Tax=Dendrothele bispora (strain CBS 962.96) TaxID=1314807 RepID=A0A4S8LKK5_DENBC|nr:hypothetical protein K435DRAFT_802696 [Dendrothele bispora CBS 962.96]